MDTWVQLLVRELLLVAILGAAGIGFVAFLPACVDRTSRLALAPVFGFCAASSLLMTSIWLVPAGTGWPLLASLVAASVLVAFRVHRRRAGDGPPIRP